MATEQVAAILGIAVGFAAGWLVRSWVGRRRSRFQRNLLAIRSGQREALNVYRSEAFAKPPEVWGVPICESDCVKPGNVFVRDAEHRYYWPKAKGGEPKA